MSIVSRRYDFPDEFKSELSIETGNVPTQIRRPTLYKELARSRKGFYQGQNVPDKRRILREHGLLPLTNYTRFDSVKSQSGYRIFGWKPYEEVYYDHGVIKTRMVYNTSQYPTVQILESCPEISVPDQLALESYCTRYADRAESLLQEAAAEVLDSFDVLTWLGELAEVKGLFLSCGAKIMAHLARRPAKAAANAWLEWQFGWKQLFRDISSIGKMITKIGGHDTINKKTKRWSTTENTSWFKRSGAPNGSVAQYCYSNSQIVRVDINAQVVTKVSHILPDITFNPFATAWELIPFSFVIDYFYNIGSWIAANSFASFDTRYFASIGYRVCIKNTTVMTPGAFDPTVYRSFDCNGSADVTATLYKRVPTTISLSQPPRFAIDKIGVTRMINLISLMVQAMSGRNKRP